MIPENYDVYKLTKEEKLNYLLKSFGILFLCGYVFYADVLPALFIGGLSLLGIGIYKRSLAEKRKGELRIQFKDMLYSISSSVTSGRHMDEAIIESEKTIACLLYTSPSPRDQVKNMCRIMRETNCSEETVLIDLSERSKVREICDFTDVCLTCRTTGGDINMMIQKAVSLLTENIELQKEKEVTLSQKKLESKLLACMPVAVTGLTNMASPDYLEAMYTTAFGRVLMTIALLGTCISFLWSMKMTNGSLHI